MMKSYTKLNQDMCRSYNELKSNERKHEPKQDVIMNYVIQQLHNTIENMTPSDQDVFLRKLLNFISHRI